MKVSEMILVISLLVLAIAAFLVVIIVAIWPGISIFYRVVLIIIASILAIVGIVMFSYGANGGRFKLIP